MGLLQSGLGWSANEAYTTHQLDWSDPKEQIDAAKKSIKDFGGFYIARYEVGWTGNTQVETYPQSKEKDKTELKPVSKKGIVAWNCITQPHAKTVSENMIKTNEVQSYLIDSQAWNVICKYILIPKIGEEKVLEDSSTWGNFCMNTTTRYEQLSGLHALHTYIDTFNYAEKYKNGRIDASEIPHGLESRERLELATGLCDDFKVYNIYDMAGNMGEWTTETVNHDKYIYAAIRRK